MVRMKSSLVLIFFILAGIIVGSLVAGATANMALFSWLSYGSSVGISAANPMVIDLEILVITFGFEMGINISQIIFIFIALFCYNSFGKRI